MRRTKREQETDQIWAQEEGKHRTWGHSSDIIPPPPLPTGASRAVQHPMGRGGGRSGGLKGPGDRTGGLQGGAHSGTHGGAGSSGGYGGRRDSGEWQVRLQGRGCGHCPCLYSWIPTTPPPPPKKARQIAFEGPALEDTLGAQGLRSACKGLALEGTLGAQALHRVCEGPALGLSEQLLAGLPYALSAGLPYFLPAGLTYSLPSAWESRGRRRACVGWGRWRACGGRERRRACMGHKPRRACGRLAGECYGRRWTGLPRRRLCEESLGHRRAGSGSRQDTLQTPEDPFPPS